MATVLSKSSSKVNPGLSNVSRSKNRNPLDCTELDSWVSGISDNFVSSNEYYSQNLYETFTRLVHQLVIKYMEN